ncbi:hypothetical protein ACHAW5_000694 [Stephanodiscus triporus]|uniref:Uncharacterized protein n=1 Tax=Stephanodiscus triporus TaxID=2934178 RepID=A0ABD3P3W5_9STRA
MTSIASSSSRRRQDFLAGGGSILDDYDESLGPGAEGGGRQRRYRPSHPASRAAYGAMLGLISGKRYLGDQHPSILESAIEEILSVLKDGGMTDPNRKEDISRLLTGRGAGEEWTRRPDVRAFAALGKAMDDYDRDRGVAER